MNATRGKLLLAAGTSLLAVGLAWFVYRGFGGTRSPVVVEPIQHFYGGSPERLRIPFEYLDGPLWGDLVA